MIIAITHENEAGCINKFTNINHVTLRKYYCSVLYSDKTSSEFSLKSEVIF